MRKQYLQLLDNDLGECWRNTHESKSNDLDPLHVPFDISLAYKSRLFPHLAQPASA
jgi:hypothetical protein